MLAGLSPEALIALPEAVVGLGIVLAVAWKLIRFANKVETALPTLFNIADEFSPNSGSSLKDSVDRIEASQAASCAWQVQHAKDDLAFQSRVEPYITAGPRP